jgi:hypothetical protein
MQQSCEMHHMSLLILLMTDYRSCVSIERHAKSVILYEYHYNQRIQFLLFHSYFYRLVILVCHIPRFYDIKMAAMNHTNRVLFSH